VEIISYSSLVYGVDFDCVLAYYSYTESLITFTLAFLGHSSSILLYLLEALGSLGTYRFSSLRLGDIHDPDS
jgi:hypothetical protein